MAGPGAWWAGTSAKLRRAPSRDQSSPTPERHSFPETVKLDIYINYPGTCRDAFRFYEQHLGGRIVMMMNHGDLPESRVTAEFRDKVLHAQLALGGSVIRGADIPNTEPMRSAYVTLSLDSSEEAE